MVGIFAESVFRLIELESIPYKRGSIFRRNHITRILKSIQNIYYILYVTVKVFIFANIYIV